jgi:hypothetical protein
VPALDLWLDELVAEPTQAVTGDLVAARRERRHRLRIAGERRRHPEDRQRQAAAVEHPQHPPQPVRDPYSYSDSMLMFRFGNGWAPTISDRNVSDAGSPWSTLFSAPSS